MAPQVDPVEILTDILIEHGPLFEDEITQKLQQAGVADVEFYDLLDGHTPRQAAEAPTRRADLIKLFASFPPGRPGAMDPDRLRSALGLN